MTVRAKPSEMRGHLLKDVNEVVSKASGASRVHSVVLFGSAARGDVNESSDVDLLLVCSNVLEARRVVHRLNHRFEVTVYSPGELASMAKLGLPFIHHLSREGVVLIDDGSYRTAIKNLRDTSVHTLRAIISDVREAMKVYSTLLEFDLPYFVHVFEPFLNLVEAYLCMCKLFIFNKEKAVKKLVELRPELSPFQNYMLRLLSVYRDYTRLGLHADINLNKFVETVREVLRTVEGELPRES